MIVLVVVPDFVSHWYPLSAVARTLRGRGHDVVVATGSTLAPRVLAEGHRHVQVRLGAGGNSGLTAVGADPAIDAFLAATRLGMVATLRHQAERRRHDLLWQPRTVATDLGLAVRDVGPDVVLVDQLAFGASAALRGFGVPFLSFLPGHPCQLPAGGELFGYPSLLPPVFGTPAEELRSLRELCDAVSVEFTSAYNDAVRTLGRAAEPVADAFGAGGTLGTLVNYPRSLGGHAERRPAALFLGSCVRAPEGDRRLEALEAGGRPRAYVSLGSFLSARTDVLASIAQALRLLGWDALIATGAGDPARLGPLPGGWLVADQLPQVAALAKCDIVVCHGGNNTVTEALTAGLPVLAAPFSTDQFAGAADLGMAGLGAAVDPETASPERIADLLASLLAGKPGRRAAACGRALRATPGHERAADAVEAAGRHPALDAVA